jgi:hypothetical protein
LASSGTSDTEAQMANKRAKTDAGDAASDSFSEISVEGLEDPEESEQVFPRPAKRIDPDEFFSRRVFRVVYQTNNFLLPQINSMLGDREILNIRPEYQRRLRWSSIQKSRLIESLLLNVPIPPVFFYESSGARYEVMDGQQRLNAIREYMEGELALSGLQVLAPLNGVRYPQAPPRMKRALERATISAIVLLMESDSENRDDGQFSISDIRRFVFDRLNTGGTKLNAQELRNAIYHGHFNDALVELTRNEVFTEIFEIPPYVESDEKEYYENPRRRRNTLFKTMGDCQLVLRYFALRDAGNIRGSMQSMLDRAMETRMTLSKEDVGLLKEEYLSRLRMAREIFGPRPFLLPAGSGPRRLSAALYDATLVALHRLWKSELDLPGHSEGIRKRLAEEYEDAERAAILTAQGNTANAVKARIAALETVLREGSA